MSRAEKAAKKLGGMSGKAASAIMKTKRRKQSRLESIMGSMRDNQSTDSNNRK